MRKAPKMELWNRQKRYLTPSSTVFSLDLQTALLDISDWEHGGSFSLLPDEPAQEAGDGFVDLNMDFNN